MLPTHMAAVYSRSFAPSVPKPRCVTMYPVHTILSLSGAHLPVLPLPPLSQLLQTLPSNSPLSYHSPCTHMGIEEEYLLSLSDRKQPKALISQSLFDKIYAALQNGSEDRGSTAQFRFWVRKIGLCNAPFALLLGPQGTYGQVRKGLSYLHPQAKRKPRPPLAVQLSAPLLSYLLSAPAPAPAPAPEPADSSSGLNFADNNAGSSTAASSNFAPSIFATPDLSVYPSPMLSTGSRGGPMMHSPYLHGGLFSYPAVFDPGHHTTSTLSSVFSWDPSPSSPCIQGPVYNSGAAGSEGEQPGNTDDSDEPERHALHLHLPAPRNVTASCTATAATGRCLLLCSFCP